MHRRTLLGGAAAATLAGAPAARAQSPGMKIAFVVTLSGPGAAIGTQMRDGWLLGVKEMGGKMGALPVETLVINDELKPDVALTKVRATLERDKVDFVAGVVFNNILQASFRPVTESQTILVSANAGTSTFAGKGCNPFFYATSSQNDQTHATMGQVAQDEGYKRVMILVPNYQAGRDAVHGFRSRCKGEVVDESYVPLTQPDFSAEMAKIAAAKPDALFTFMPGEIHAVIGPNGAGKTTLIHQISGALKPDSGQVLVAGQDVTAWPMPRCARIGLGRTFRSAASSPASRRWRTRRWRRRRAPGPRSASRGRRGWSGR